jgi:hypothetical protein
MNRPGSFRSSPLHVCAMDLPHFAGANEKGRRNDGPSRSRMVFRGLLQSELPDRCDDYRGCSINKRNDPRPTETFDF